MGREGRERRDIGGTGRRREVMKNVALNKYFNNFVFRSRILRSMHF